MSACGGHSGHSGGLPSELRAVVLLALDRFAPVLERVGAEPATGPSSCGSCLVCALLAALRGERPELAVRFAEQATGLVTALRAVLEEDVAPPPPPAPSRPVQRIHVERTTPRHMDTCGCPGRVGGRRC